VLLNWPWDSSNCLGRNLPNTLHVLACGLEWLLHLIALFPWFEVTSFSQYSAIYLLLLALFIKNAVKWMYWTCDFSTSRYGFYVHLHRCKSLKKLAFKGYLRQHGFLVLMLTLFFPMLAAFPLDFQDRSIWQSVKSIVHTLTRIQENNGFLLYGSLSVLWFFCRLQS